MKHCISVALAVLVFVSLCVPAYAANYCSSCGAKITNSSAKYCSECGANISRTSSSSSLSGSTYVYDKPSVADIEAVGDSEKITHPDGKDYLDEYETMYVKAPKGHSIYVFWDARADADCKRPWYAYEGDEVAVIARHGSMSCVLFVNGSGIMRAGWVISEYLVYDY